MNRKYKTVALLSDRDLFEFDAAIIRSGFSINDFTVANVVDGPITHGQHSTTSAVTVHRVSSGEFIIYRAGSNWIPIFEADLHAGKFSGPSF